MTVDVLGSSVSSVDFSGQQIKMNNKNKIDKQKEAKDVTSGELSFWPLLYKGKQKEEKNLRNASGHNINITVI